MPAIDPLEELNAAGQKAALPGVGAPQSTPQTDQTNLNIATSMERADLGNRFGFGSQEYQQGTATPRFAPDTSDILNSVIDSRMSAIARGQDPDHPAQYVGPRRSSELQHEFLALGETKRRNALVDAKMAHEAAVAQTSAKVSTGIAKIMKHVSSLPYPDGTPEREEAVLEFLGSGDPDVMAAMGSKNGAAIMRPFITHHDQAKILKSNIDLALAQTRLRNQEILPKNMTPQDILNPTVIKAGTYDPEANDGKGKFTPADKGDFIMIENASGKRSILPKNQYQTIKETLEGRQPQAQTEKKTLKYNPQTGELE